MTRRMLDSSLWTNEHFGEMPMMARLLLLGIINHADDQGRIKAHSVFLRAQIFPYDDIAKEKIDECLTLIQANGTIALYEANGKRYLQLLNWWEYQTLQFASPSDCPLPDGWRDRIRYNAKGGMTLTCNWSTPKGETPEDTCDQDGKPLPIVATFPVRNPGGRPRKTDVETQVETDVETQIEEEDHKEVKEEEKREATATQGVPASKPPPHPAIVIFKEVWKRNPNKPQMKTISERVTDLDLWRDACQAWGDRGHKPTNVEGMIDWYEHPERFQTSYRPPPNGRDHRSTNNGVNAVMDYIQDKGMFK